MERDLVIGSVGRRLTCTCDAQREAAAGHYDTGKPCHHPADPDTRHHMLPRLVRTVTGPQPRGEAETLPQEKAFQPGKRPAFRICYN
jgi:hypothetical protein